MNNQEIENHLKQALSLDEVYALSEDGSHFQVIAVSAVFAEMSRVKRQQFIYTPLADYIASNVIHALSIKTYTPEQWQRERKLMGL